MSCLLGGRVFDERENFDITGASTPSFLPLIIHHSLRWCHLSQLFPDDARASVPTLHTYSAPSGNPSYSLIVSLSFHLPS